MKLTKTTLCILLASGSLAFAASAEAAGPWSGFYLGGDVGGAFSTSTGSTTTAYVSNGTSYFSPISVSSINANGTQNLNPNGFVGGAKAGY